MSLTTAGVDLSSIFVKRLHKSKSPILDFVIPSPDWFLSCCTSLSEWRESSLGYSALLSYSAKNTLYIVKINVDEGFEKCHFEFERCFDAHHKKVLAVSLIDDSECSSLSCILASGGQDGLLRLWNITDDSTDLVSQLTTYNISEDLHPTALSLIRLPKKCSFLIVCGTNRGHIIIASWEKGVSKLSSIHKKFENEAVLHCVWDNKLGDLTSCRAAVGYRKGIVGVYHYSKASALESANISQLFRVYAHDKDVCHVSWRPHTQMPISNVNYPDLATSGRDQVVKLWVVNESWCYSSTRIPGQNRQNADSSHRFAKEDSMGAPWISIAWSQEIASDESYSPRIYATNSGGEFFLWEPDKKLLKSLKLSSSSSSKTSGHSKVIFSLCSSLSKFPPVFVSVGQDRKIIFWKQNATAGLDQLYELVTIQGSVLSLSQSAQGFSPIACGISDGSIYLWRSFINLSINADGDQAKSIDSKTPENLRNNVISIIWPLGKMSAGITSLAWHPLRHQEHLLALGSESGIVDVLDTSKPIRHGSGSRLYGQSMGSIVYRVAWGPPLLPRARRENISGSDAVQVAGDADLTFIADEKKDKASKNLFVYSICKGKLWFHFGHGRQPCEVGSKLPVPNESYLDSSTLLSDVAFRFASPSSDPISSSFSCIFSVGLLSGDVDIFALSRNESDQDYFHCHYVCRVKIHNKCINSLVWSPDPSYWLAIGSNEIFITITDLKSVLLLASGSHEKLGHRITPELTSHLLRIEGHSNRITSLDWSPFSPGLLLSVSYDGTANVWQISPRSDSASAPSGQEAPVLYNMTPLANFRGHRLRLYAGLWSRQEPDLVITGGECSSIFSWRPSLQAAFQQPPSSRRFRPPLAPKVVEVDSSNVTSLSSHDSDSVVIKSGISLLTPDSGKTGETYETNGSYSVSGPGELTKKHESAGFTIAQICNEDISLSGRARKEKARHGGLMRRMAGEGRDAGGFIRRPSLFPSLFGGPGVCTSPEPTNSCLDFSCIPPVQLNSRLQTALMLTRHMASLEKFEPGQSGGLGPETASPPSLMAALVYGVPDDYPSRRMHLVRLVEAEANRHLAVFTEAEEKAQIRQSGSAPMVASGHWLHLEAYFFLLIWLGRATLVAQSAKLYGYFPYWLLWALQMAVSPPMPIQALDDEIDLLVEKVKELTTRDPDPQLVSALLVCGHRPVEAVNHLLQASRFREALVLLQLRLPAHLGQPLFAACLARLAELRPGNSPLDTNGLPDCLACYIGLRNWPRTARFLREAVLRLEHRFQAASSTSLLLTASLAREKGSQLVPAVDSASASHSIVATLSDPSVEEDISDQTKALVSAAELASTLAADLLATGWLEVVLLDINQLSEALLVSLPRHAFSCLQVAFQSTEESFSLLDFLAAWATAYLKKLRPSPALAAGHLILYYGHLLASALRFAQPPSPFSSEDTRVPPAPCFSDAPNLTASSAEAGIVQALVGLTLDRQSSQPIGRSVFAQLAVDLAVCHLVAYADSNSGAEAAGTGFSTDQIACHLGQLRQTLALCARQDSVALATVSTAVRRCLLGRDSSALESERAPHVQAVVDLLQTYASISQSEQTHVPSLHCLSTNPLID